MAKDKSSGRDVHPQMGHKSVPPLGIHKESSPGGEPTIGGQVRDTCLSGTTITPSGKGRG